MRKNNYLMRYLITVSDSNKRFSGRMRLRRIVLMLYYSGDVER